MKVRLYRGPFDGKVIKDWAGGGATIVLNGTKKMSRKQRSRQFMEQQLDPLLYAYPYTNIVTAVYRRTQFVHPDGSVFYEWDQPRPPRSPRKRNKDSLPY